MNGDERAYTLSHVYDPFLIRSALSTTGYEFSNYGLHMFPKFNNCVFKNATAAEIFEIFFISCKTILLQLAFSISKLSIDFEFFLLFETLP